MRSAPDTDVPSPEWCSALDAALWIMIGRQPVSAEHVGLVPGTAPDFSFNGIANRQKIREHEDYKASWRLLYQAAKDGIVRLKGRRAIGPVRIVSSIVSGYSVQCDKWDESGDITISTLKAAGPFAFNDLEEYGFFPDRIISSPMELPETALLYVDVLVNVPDLFEFFASSEGGAPRVGTEVIFSARKAALEPVPSSPNVSPNHRGGRPIERDWEGAVNATWAALYTGQFEARRSLDLKKWMLEWFARTDEKGPPDEKEVRKRTNKMWDAIEATERDVGKT